MICPDITPVSVPCGGFKPLSLLVCTIPRRNRMLQDLLTCLELQEGFNQVELLTDNGAGSIGVKRQRLLTKATGDYVAFIDDDDQVNTQYIKNILPHLGTVDAIGFEGQITTNGRNAKRFTISKDHNYEEKEGVYYRYNNHLSPIRREIALQIGYKDMQFMEDYDYATRLKESGLVKTEAYIYTPMYFYKYVSKKSTYLV
jgi:glycosyltransferase involved in cell wall biosynthesis